MSPRRGAEAAKRFFAKALAAPHTSTPRVITMDKNAAYPKAFKELKAEKVMPDACELRQSKYLNNLIDAAITASSNGWSSLGWASFPFFLRDRVADVTGI